MRIHGQSAGGPIQKADGLHRADYKFIGYDSAMHAFTNPASTENGKKFKMPIAYNAKADTASWKEMQTFLVMC